MPSLSASTYVLHDINEANAERVARFSNKLKGELGVSAAIETETDPDKALKEADFIIITIATGGLDAMGHDLSIPEQYGIYQTVGDTVGPGGWARALRNIPVFTDLAQRINHLAPKSVILNYSNPMAQLTKSLCLSTCRPVVGLCHGLFASLGFLREVFELDSAGEIACIYGGVNHFFWITSLSIKGGDGYKLLSERMGGQSLPQLHARTHPGEADSYLADELLRFTGLLTYVRDRHTSEFFPQYLTSEKNMARYHLKRTTVEERRESMRQTEEEIEQMTAGCIPDRYKRRSRETAADIIDALVTGNEIIDVGNVPNLGQVANLPMGSVLETPVLIAPCGIRPITVGCLPEPVRTWVERHVRVQDLTVEAGITGDLEKALRALALDPLVSHLELAEVREMGTRLLKANARYLPQFF